ncbi:MAG: CPBP family intramembrane metalloprotease [Bacteroidales bacterium]|nr:CPBP family intramembrane metalloprotease [Bacteroidales bacterium]
MKGYFNNTKPFGQLLTLVGLVVLFFIVGTSIMSIAMVGGAEITDVRFQWLFQAVTQLLTFFLPALIFASLFTDSVRGSLQLDFHAEKWLMAIASIVILICLMPFSDWLAQINDGMHLPERFTELELQLRERSAMSQEIVVGMLSQQGVAALIVNLLVIALVPALCEEFFFRGALQHFFCRWMKNHHVAIIATAAVFSLMHGDIFGFLPRFMLGILLGYLFHYSRSILVNVVVHFFNNALIVILYYLYYQGTTNSNIAEDVHVSGIVVVVGIAFALVIFYALFLRQKSEKQSSNQA